MHIKPCCDEKNVFQCNTDKHHLELLFEHFIQVLRSQRVVSRIDGDNGLTGNKLYNSRVIKIRSLHCNAFIFPKSSYSNWCLALLSVCFTLTELTFCHHAGTKHKAKVSSQKVWHKMLPKEKKKGNLKYMIDSLTIDCVTVVKYHF